MMAEIWPTWFTAAERQEAIAGERWASDVSDGASVLMGVSAAFEYGAGLVAVEEVLAARQEVR